MYTPMHDIAMASNADKVERLLAGLVDFGFLEARISKGGECEYVPTEGLVEFLGLDAVGITIENGVWKRFSG
jgi:hypothetical protein